MESRTARTGFSDIVINSIAAANNAAWNGWSVLANVCRSRRHRFDPAVLVDLEYVVHLPVHRWGHICPATRKMLRGWLGWALSGWRA